MKPPNGGEPVQVSTKGDEIAQHMVAGYTQIFPDEPTPAPNTE
ncbi:MAG TPA: hypothetical protein PLX06_12345 [Fimbriimonadaceae bacterium]|nr:hypothetical protein [Fimbriimonadaceae bacterium]